MSLIKTYVACKRKAVIWGALSFLTGCCGSDSLFHSTRVERQDEAGSTYTAVLSIAPWDRYRDALQPTFKLGADDALKIVVPDSMALEEKTVDALVAKAKVALPMSDTSSTQTITRQTGKPLSETSTVTQSTSPGDASKITFEASPSAGMSAGSLPPSTSVLSTPLGEDPMLRYWVATALYQEVQLLDRYVKDAAISEKYYPYLLRTQVTLMPRRRDLPYDAYATISFFDGEFNGDVPLLRSFVSVEDVTQRLRKVEYAGKSSSDFSQSLVDMVGQAPHISAADPGEKYVATDSLNQALKERAATFKDSADLNKAMPDILSSARALTSASKTASAPVIVPLLVTDDLEAAIQSKSVDQIRQLALALAASIHGVGVEGDLQKMDEQLRTVLGRDFNSTFTIARASDNTVRMRFGASLQAQSHYAMIPQAHNVTLLVLVPKAYVDGEHSPLLRLVSKTNFLDAECGCELKTWSRDEIVHERDAVLTKYLGETAGVDGDQLLQLADVNDYDGFATALKSKTRYPETLWLELISLRNKSQFSFSRVEVPRPVPSAVVSGQTAALLDDPKAGTSVLIRCEGETYASQISATLQLSQRQPMAAPAPQAGAYASTSTKVSDDGHSVMFVFPSLKAYGLTNKNGTLNDNLTAQVVVFSIDKQGRVISNQSLPALYVAKVPTDPAFSLEARAKIIDMHPDGSGELELVASKLDTPPAAGWDISLSIDGADLDGDPTGDPIAVDPKTREVKINKNGTILLKFKNLNAVSNVTVGAKDNATGQSIKPLVLFVMQPDRNVVELQKIK
jgi:hypothetical protein